MKRIALYIVVMFVVIAVVDYFTFEAARPVMGITFVVGLVVIVVQEIGKQQKKPSA